MTTTTMTPQGKPCLPGAATMAATHLQMHPLAEHLKHRLHHNIFVVLIVPTHLHHCRCHCCRCHCPPKMPLPKLVECDLQEIVCVLPRFRVDIIVVLHCDAIAVVALSVLPPNEPDNVDRGPRTRCSYHTPRCRRGAPPCRNNQAVEDPICQT